MKKMLLVGGGYADIPLILSAKKLGFYVVTSGNRNNDLGHRYSDEVQLADFSDCEAIYNLAKKTDINAICSCCNDFSALSAAYTAEKLHLPGHDSYEVSKIIHHKDLYRNFALLNGINAPKALGFSNTDEALLNLHKLKLPIIIKPVDLTGGKGITVIHSIDQAEHAINIAYDRSKAKRIVAEEFIEGSRHGFSAFLYKGKIVFFFSDNEHYYINQYLVSAATTPSIITKEVEEKLITESEQIASLLNLKDGIFHIQFILKKQEPFIIEICRRAPGDLYVKLVEYATGIDYSMFIVKASAGIDCKEIEQTEITGFYTRHCIMSEKNGLVQNIKYDESIKNNIIDQFLWWGKGDVISDFMTEKCGIVFLKFDSKDEMLYKTDRMQELIKVEIGEH